MRAKLQLWAAFPLRAQHHPRAESVVQRAFRARAFVPNSPATRARQVRPDPIGQMCTRSSHRQRSRCPRCCRFDLPRSARQVPCSWCLIVRVNLRIPMAERGTNVRERGHESTMRAACHQQWCAPIVPATIRWARCAAPRPIHQGRRATRLAHRVPVQSRGARHECCWVPRSRRVVTHAPASLPCIRPVQASLDRQQPLLPRGPHQPCDRPRCQVQVE